MTRVTHRCKSEPVLDVENASNQAQIHFEKTNINFPHDCNKGLLFTLSLQYPFISSSPEA